MIRKEFNSFDELENYLRDWKSYKDPEIYDLNGMAALMAACLDNLSTNMCEEDFENIELCFTEEQKQFLARLVKNMPTKT